LLFPPALFLAVWLVTLVGLLLFGDPFYPVPDKAYYIYIVGAAAFTFGGILALRLGSSPSEASPIDAPWRGSPSTYRALDLTLLVLVIGLPFYWRQVSESVSLDDLSTMFHSLRDEQLARAEEGSSFNIIANLVGLSHFTAAAMFLESNADPRRRWRAIVAVILAFIYGGMLGAKINGLSLVIILALIASVQARRIKLSTVGATVALAVGFFSMGLLLVNFAYESFGGSSELVQKVAHGLRLYWLSGLVAFGVIALNPDAMPSTQQIDRFFWDTARSLGANVTPPPKYADFTNVSLTEYTNVYTIYFSYFKDYGWIGTVILMSVMGALMTLLYKRAMSGKPIAMILFGHFGFSVIVLSIVAESGFSLLNTHIKFIIFLLFMYWLLPAFDAWRETSRA